MGYTQFSTISRRNILYGTLSCACRCQHIAGHLPHLRNVVQSVVRKVYFSIQATFMKSVRNHSKFKNVLWIFKICRKRSDSESDLVECSIRYLIRLGVVMRPFIRKICPFQIAIFQSITQNKLCQNL